MFRIMWAVKRAHWQSATEGRRELRKLGSLTPARADVLHVLNGRRLIAQRALREILGVVKSTLSELLARMEQLGLVERGRRTRLGRTVAITTKGRSLLDGAFWAFAELDLRVMDAVGDESEEQQFEQFCLRMRRALGDVAPPHIYDWFVLDD